MTTIMLEVPDELAVRLAALRERLPDLLSKMLESPPGNKTSQTLKSGGHYPVYREMIDFLASGPTPEQIKTFRISAAAQDRLEELLDKNREEGLIEAESVELDIYQLVHNAMVLLKARACATGSSSH